MPIATIQAPDGKVLTIEVPQGASEQEIYDFVSKNYNPSVQESVEANPPAVEQIPATSKQTPSPQKTDDSLANLLAKDQDYIPIYSDLLRPTKEAGNLLLQGIGHAASFLTGDKGYATAMDKITKADRKAYEQNVSKDGLGTASSVAEFGGNFITPVGTVGRLGKGVKGILASGAVNGALGSLLTPFYAEDGQEGDTDNFIKGKATDAAIGATLGTTFNGANQAVRGIIPKLTDAITPRVGKIQANIAQRAKDMGFDLRLDQVAPTRVRSTVQKVSQDIPFSGVGSAEDTQNALFHRKLAEQIGVRGVNDLGPDTINTFMKQNSEKWKTALEGVDIMFDDDSLKKFDEILQSSKTNLADGSEAQRVVQNYHDMVMKNFDKSRGTSFEVGTPSSKPGTNVAKIGQSSGPSEYDSFNLNANVLNGNKAQSLRSNLLEASKRADSRARPFISDMIKELDEIIEQNIPGERSDLLKEASREYRNFKTLEPLLEKSPDGNINPTELLTRIKTSPYIKNSRIRVGEDDFVDLARIGKRLFPKKGGSDTQSKLTGTATATAFFGALASGNLPLATSIAIGATGITSGNTALQKFYNMNQGLVNNSIQKSMRKNRTIEFPGLVTSQKRANSASQGISRETSKDNISQSYSYENDPEFQAILDEYGQADSAPIGEQSLLKQGDSFDYQNDPEFQAILTEFSPSNKQVATNSLLDKFESIESGGNPNARSKTSSASGSFGFTDSTWRLAVNKWGKEAGITYKDKNNKDAQRFMALKLMEDDKRIVENKIGRELDNSELYANHFFGATAAPRFFTAYDNNPNAQAFRLYSRGVNSKEVRANKPIFFKKDGSPRTVAEVYNLFQQKVNQA